ncbi:TonB-dependent receptor [Halpernia frigidisoli]|uniref:Carboxypeptidase regulatory-like domain-containing protein n=1 Tax=Halpernia frigidisoli TaxID=1125876 RepID=A0A1I3HNG4_9FLAO|nr:carboxypeptidase regulatory-like domain-containing protein [Halpernia frigidisoli]SFI37231.1 Carboxypeptidase regulatory-like domain-containing protein [Halpernia frigidisoli]
MKNLLLFLFLSFSGILFAQNTISGKITDSDGQPIPSASVTVEEAGKDAIIAYSITNSKGEYKVTFTTAVPNLDLKIKAFNQKPFLKSVSNSTQTSNFSLESQATEIKEVKIKTRMITKKGDTISYDLKAFENKSDRSLADVLKKIPGIEVNPDGSVLYQGEPINKFYVNGKDLMEGAYGSINNALPKDAVQKVEVLENHQPVKILQDKVPSQNAALNVVLKKSVTMTGRGEVGAGFADPFAYNVKLTPMFFGQKVQYVVNYKTNNNGESVENDGNLLSFGNRFEGRRGNVSQNNWIGVEKADTPNLPEKRYLFNNVHYLAANFLTNIDKDKQWELKGNASYTNNAISRDYLEQTTNLQTNTAFATTISNKLYTDKLKGELIFTKNAKKGFFKNTTTFSQFWNGDRAEVSRNSQRVGLQAASESVNSPTSSFQNSLSTIIPWKEKMVNLMSYINYQDDAQSLEFTPASYANVFPTNADKLQQDFKLKTFEANHSVNLGFSAKNWTFTPEVGFDYNYNLLNTQLLGYNNKGLFGFPSTYTNDLKFTTAKPYAQLGVNYKSDSWQLYSNFPVNFNSIKADDPRTNVSKDLNKVTFEPNAFAQYSFASFWKASFFGNLNYNFGSIQDTYAGYLLTNPNFINAVAANTPISESISKSAGPRIEYRNPLNNLFFNIRYNYSTNKSNVIATPLVDAIGRIITNYIEQDNSSTSNNESVEVGKYFPKFKTNASINASNNKSLSDQFQNNLFYKSERNSQNVGFKFNNAYFSWVSVDFNFTKSWTDQNTILGGNIKSTGYNHNLTTAFYPLENNIITFNWDQINSGQGNINYKNPFYDIAYQYTWAKKKIDFEVKWLNIANRKVFERFDNNPTLPSFTRIQLRPTQVMFTVKFNFK